MPKLVDVMSALASTDPQATIYVAAPVGPESDAMVRVQPVDGGGPVGYAYLLEVSLARDVIEVWATWRNGKQPTPEEAARAVIYYAQHDAYEPARPAD